MQSVPIVEIIEQVKIILNENIKEDAFLLEDSSQLELDELIRSRIVDAVRLIHEAAPSHLLDDGLDMPIDGKVYTNENGSGHIELPDDFMRLVIFHLETWSRPVIQPISDTDPQYFLQKSRFLGIRGGTDKPICALTTGVNGRVLEFYSIAPGQGVGGVTKAEVSKAKYLPLPEIKTDDSILVCRKLLSPIHYECAGLVAVTVKDELATALFGVSKSFL